jgi:hypothetical protein
MDTKDGTDFFYLTAKNAEITKKTLIFLALCALCALCGCAILQSLQKPRARSENFALARRE